MAFRLPEAEVLLCIASALARSVDHAMDRLWSLLPATAPRSMPEPKPKTLPEPEIGRAEDIAVQQAVDEVLEYHRTHRPKNTTKNYEPKQRE